MGAQLTRPLADDVAGRAAGDGASALSCARRAVEAARASGDREREAAALCALAGLHWRLSHFARAQDLAARAAARTAAATLRARALTIVGACAAARDDLATGEAALQRAAALSRGEGDAAGHSRALQHLASQVQLRRGQFDLALTTAALAARLGPPERQASAWLLRAWVYQLTGEPRRAAEALGVLQGLAPQDARAAAAAALLAAQLALDDGDLPRAGPLLDEALAAAETSGHPLLQIGARVARSRWHRLRGDGAAHAWAADAVALARRLGSRSLEGQALIARGLAAWAAGDPGAAAGDLRGALATLDGVGAACDAAHAALLLAALGQQLGRAEAEAAWLDAAQRIATGGYGFLLERERHLALPLLAAHMRSRDAAVRDAAAALACGQWRPPPPLHITALGEFVVRQGHRTLPAHGWAQRRAGELFRFLLLQPHHSACRTVIGEALWPDKAPPAAERLLQQATWALRHVLEPELPAKFPSRYLTVADHHIALLLPQGSTLDAALFESAVQRALDDPGEGLEAALALYTGALFPLDRYADWAAGPRQRLAELYVLGLLRLAGQLLAGQRPEQALACCDRVLAEDRWNEEAAKLAMRACLARGDRPGALRRFEALRRALRHDLRLAPRADLCALADAVRAQP